MAIDLREDIRAQMAMAQNLGAGVGNAIRSFRKQAAESRIGQILNDPDFDPITAQNQISQVKGYADTQAYQQYQKIVSAQQAQRLQEQRQAAQPVKVDFYTPEGKQTSRMVPRGDYNTFIEGIQKQGYTLGRPVADTGRKQETAMVSDLGKLNRLLDDTIDRDPTPEEQSQINILSQSLLKDPGYKEQVRTHTETQLPTMFEEVMQDKPKETRKKYRLGDDEAYMGKAYELALSEITPKLLNYGYTPEEVKTKFDSWWDQQVESEKGQKYQKFGARPQTQASGEKELDPQTAQSILQEARGDKKLARRIATERGYKL